jgi:hypothetical protein
MPFLRSPRNAGRRDPCFRRCGLCAQAPSVRRLRQALHHLRAAGGQLSCGRQKRRQPCRLRFAQGSCVDGVGAAQATSEHRANRQRPHASKSCCPAGCGRSTRQRSANWSCANSSGSTRLLTSASRRCIGASKTWMNSGSCCATFSSASVAHRRYQTSFSSANFVNSSLQRF